MGQKVYDQAVKRAEAAAAPPQTLTVQDTIAIVEQAIDKKLGQQHGPKDESIRFRRSTPVYQPSAPQRPPATPAA